MNGDPIRDLLLLTKENIMRNQRVYNERSLNVHKSIILANLRHATLCIEDCDFLSADKELKDLIDAASYQLKGLIGLNRIASEITN